MGITQDAPRFLPAQKSEADLIICPKHTTGGGPCYCDKEQTDKEITMQTMPCSNTAALDTYERIQTQQGDQSESRRKAMVEWIANELSNDRPVFDGRTHWTFDDVQTEIDNDSEVARLHRMLMGAKTNMEKERAASGYQLLFRQKAHTIAEMIVDDVMRHHDTCNSDLDLIEQDAFETIFNTRAI